MKTDASIESGTADVSGAATVSSVAVVSGASIDSSVAVVSGIGVESSTAATQESTSKEGAHSVRGNLSWQTNQIAEQISPVSGTTVSAALAAIVKSDAIPDRTRS